MMRKITKAFFPLVLALVLALAGTAWAGGKKKSCLERCDDKIAMCIDGCTKGVEKGKGGNKDAAKQKCREGCKQYKERCAKKCASRK